MPPAANAAETPGRAGLCPFLMMTNAETLAPGFVVRGLIFHVSIAPQIYFGGVCWCSLCMHKSTEYADLFRYPGLVVSTRARCCLCGSRRRWLMTRRLPAAPSSGWTCSRASGSIVSRLRPGQLARSLPTISCRPTARARATATVALRAQHTMMPFGHARPCRFEPSRVGSWPGRGRGDGWRNGEEAISGEPHASDELVEHCGALTCLAAFVGQTARGYSLPRETESDSRNERKPALGQAKRTNSRQIKHNAPESTRFSEFNNRARMDELEQGGMPACLVSVRVSWASTG